MEGVAPLPDQVLRVAAAAGLALDQSAELINLIPCEVRDAPCFLDRLTGLWRYQFGSVFDIPDAGLVLGTQMFPPVDHLFRVLWCSRERLRPEQLGTCLRRLADPRKHADLLAEFAPIARVPSNVGIEWEVPGGGTGNQNVDWLIASEKHPPVLLDVKNRVLDLIENLSQIGRGERSMRGTGPAPSHDSQRLFLSIETKFGRAKPTERLQGAWIGTQIRQEEQELHAAFGALDHERVHFAVLGDWKDDGYVLGIDDSTRRIVLDVLRMKHSSRFVFARTNEA